MGSWCLRVRWQSPACGPVTQNLGHAPQLAYAQDAGGTFGGITAFLKSITQLLIYDWGYYIGIITLAIQGYRWKTGRIDLMQLGGWGLGIGLVFFAPNIVSDLKARSSGSIQ
ncbi:TrbC/VirB2 family protein [Xanthomonas phaseoli]|uniref:TrbC/VirB2 family protein n=3 Tax=Xanthomonas phaseoli TaxID=1985254 RepID=UPI000C497672|nr:hypothetical protein XAP6164_4910012 [Xanthomonas phaseoli pv. phaseoli]